MEGYKLECFLKKREREREREREERKMKLDQNLGMKEIFKTKKFMLRQDFLFS